MGMRELVEAARHGDREAFEALVRAGSGRLYAIAYRILRDADLADDALQETLVRIWEDLPALRDPDRYDAWTYRITCRACYRIAKRERRAPVTALVEPLAPASSAFESEVADHDEMERGFRRLSIEHRSVLVLHYYLGLTISEVAEALRIAPGTVGSRLHYAMRSLRASLESEARSYRSDGAIAMTREQDLERRLADWLTDGPITAPTEVVDEAIERTVGRRQRHPLWGRLLEPLDRVRASDETRVLVLVVVLALSMLAALAIAVPLAGGAATGARDGSEQRPGDHRNHRDHRGHQRVGGRRRLRAHGACRLTRCSGEW